jgi:hypothetical protein
LPPRKSAINGPVDSVGGLELALIKTALQCIPNSPENPQPWEIWRDVNFACAHAIDRAAAPEVKREIKTACIAWSKQASGKYNRNNQRDLWLWLEKSRNRNNAKPITVATLFHFASDYGFYVDDVERAFCEACQRKLEEAQRYVMTLTDDEFLTAFGDQS